jgi:hypothetical protein
MSTLSFAVDTKTKTLPGLELSRVFLYFRRIDTSNM